MSNHTCNYCGDRHDIWDECVSGKKNKYAARKQNAAKSPPKQPPVGTKIFWKDGRTSAVLHTKVTLVPQIEKLQPLYGAKDVHGVSYHDATEQLAFSMHGVTLNQLDDKEAERIRHFARVTVDAALGLSTNYESKTS